MEIQGCVMISPHMALLTTTIGSFPKPTYVSTPDWFRMGNTTDERVVNAYSDYLRTFDTEMEKVLDRAVQEIVKAQEEVGVDIPTDGEVRREHYINYHCRHVDGVDFKRLTKRSMRDGGWVARVPTIRSKFQAREPFLVRDFQVAQKATHHPVKMTIPGPMTVAGSLADEYYRDDKKLGKDWADTINVEIKRLAEAGCEWIQIDEPLFARGPKQAVAFGVEHLERSFDGVPKHVKRVMHMCCGYPDRLDNEEYPKADRNAYLQIVEAIDASSIGYVSLEDAHRHNDLSLFGKFTKSTVILGVVAIARSRVEPVEEIMARVNEILGHIEAERLMLAPDCGLGMLPREIAIGKLEHLVEAARSVG